jgi:hypothetical protein
MTLGNMRPNGVRSLDVSCWVRLLFACARGRSAHPQSWQDDDGYSKAARSKVFELAVSPGNIKLAQLKNAGTDRVGTANQPWRQTGVGKHEQPRGYQVRSDMLKAALDAGPYHVLARRP